MEESFFDESREQSRVKSSIVSKYFEAWAQIMIRTQDLYPKKSKDTRIAYVDLFAGPGQYKDGTASTPLLVLRKAIEDEKIRERLVTIFYDKDRENIDNLNQSILGLQGIERLKHQPVVKLHEVNETIAEAFERMSLIPSLFFIDPWGYKGLSRRLIRSAIKDWGCDCIFFFNYNRINMGLPNMVVQEHMDALFGVERAARLRDHLIRHRPQDKEHLIIEAFRSALEEVGIKFFRPFSFTNAKGSRISHHLIFACKGYRGYEKMKDIMAKESTSNEQGVPSFTFNPIEASQEISEQLLFTLRQPLTDLAEGLLAEFNGQTLTMKEVYEKHNVGRDYIKRNYKQALSQLEDQKRIKTSPHKKGSFGDNVVVTFPPRQEVRE